MKRRKALQPEDALVLLRSEGLGGILENAIEMRFVPGVFAGDPVAIQLRIVDQREGSTLEHAVAHERVFTLAQCRIHRDRGPTGEHAAFPDPRAGEAQEVARRPPYQPAAEEHGIDPRLGEHLHADGHPTRVIKVVVLPLADEVAARVRNGDVTQIAQRQPGRHLD